MVGGMRGVGVGDVYKLTREKEKSMKRHVQLKALIF